jgi:hypothetical protein
MRKPMFTTNAILAVYLLAHVAVLGSLGLAALWMGRRG